MIGQTQIVSDSNEDLNKIFGQKRLTGLVLNVVNNCETLVRNRLTGI